MTAMSDRPRRRALVTGATRNLGRAIAWRLAAAGYEVLVNGRSTETVQRAVNELRAGGYDALACVADVRDLSAVESAIDAVADPSNPIDVLVNNAVSRVFGDAVSVDPAAWEMALSVLLTGPLNLMRCLLPDMRSRRHGRIINIIGLTGQAGAPGRVAVVTGKGGLIAMTKAVAQDEANFGITVNAISPGPLDTDRGADASHYRNDAPAIPVGRLGQPSEVASAVAYLASEDAAFITGQVIGVNGGRYM